MAREHLRRGEGNLARASLDYARSHGMPSNIGERIEMLSLAARMMFKPRSQDPA